MNELLSDIFLIAAGIAMIFWEMQTIKKKKKKEYSPMDSARSFSGLALGAVLILGGIFRIVIL
jgi:hypothetical protein